MIHDTDDCIGRLVTHPPLVVREEASLRSTAQRMEATGECAAVVGDPRHVVGIISDEGLSEAVAQHLDLDATPVHAVMTPYFASVEASTGLATATVAAARRGACRNPDHVLAVTDHGEVVGLLRTDGAAVSRGAPLDGSAQRGQRQGECDER